MTKQVACTPKGRFIVGRSVGRVGRIYDKDLKRIMPFIVGRIASTASRPHAADFGELSQRSLRCVGRNASAAQVRRAADATRPTMNGIMHFKSLSQMRPTLRSTMNRHLGVHVTCLVM